MATRAQMDFIGKLREKLAEQGIEDPYAGANFGAVDIRGASLIINQLKALTASAYRPVVLAAGFYQVGEEVAEVRISKAGRSYGCQLDAETGKFEYDPGLILRIERIGVPLSQEGAIEYARRTGRCAICGRKLTTERSVAAGIGPVCIKRIG